MGTRFDRLAKEMTLASRRQALTAVAAGTGGGLLALLVAPRGPAKGKRRAAACEPPCDSPEDLCCDGVCVNVVFDRENCGRCGKACPKKWDCCGQRCVKLGTEENCGGCGEGCLPEERCIDGFCVLA